MITLHATIGCFWGGPAVAPTRGFAPMRSSVKAAGRYAPQASERGSRADRQAQAAAALAAWPAQLEPAVPARAWKYIVLHHSATTAGDVLSIDEDHRGRTDAAGDHWLGIGYHFVIGNGHGMADGAVEPTFRWREQLQGAHAGVHRYNDEGIGICLVGNFNEGPPTPRQIDAARTLVSQLAGRFAIPRAGCLRHDDIGNTECPGRLFPWDQIAGPLSVKDGWVAGSRMMPVHR
ncbi:MAG: N-acetylmuramoyl-L-alanine amidase [Planctomycetia bacterium]|nr:N-acetylmuramoyl-L-alanine amidase [Planctomycetia bacterium]